MLKCSSIRLFHKQELSPSPTEVTEYDQSIEDTSTDKTGIMCFSCHVKLVPHIHALQHQGTPTRQLNRFPKLNPITINTQLLHGRTTVLTETYIANLTMNIKRWYVIVHKWNTDHTVCLFVCYCSSDKALEVHPILGEKEACATIFSHLYTYCHTCASAVLSATLAAALWLWRFHEWSLSCHQGYYSWK